jgi:hypothetical protein
MDIKRGNPKAIGRLVTAAVILGVTEPSMVYLIRAGRSKLTGKKPETWGEEMALNAAGFIPTGRDIMYGIQNALKPSAYGQSGNIGLLGWNLEACLQIVRDAHEVAGGKTWKTRTNAQARLWTDIADEVTGLAAGVPISREVNSVVGFYQTMKKLVEQ